MGLWDRISQETGVDPNTLSTFARIESGNNPGNVTGSYKGLFQLSDAEFKKHGDPGANIFDPEANARAAARKIRSESERLSARLGRPAAPHEIYLAHQQGEGGVMAHLGNPEAPAWVNMASTAEGRQKGPGWAKAAIWGNVPDDVKARYGSVDNITSQQFADLWRDKYARLGGERAPTYSDVTTQKIAQTLAAPTPGPSPMTASPMISATYDPNELTPEAVALQRKIALGLLGEGSSIAPVGHPVGALARAIQGLSGGYQRDSANEAELRSKRAENASLQGMLAAFAPRDAASVVAPQVQAPVPQPPAALTGIQRPALDGGSPRVNVPSNPTMPAIGVGAMPSAGYNPLSAPVIPDVTPTSGQFPTAAAQPAATASPKGPPTPLASSPLTVGQDTQSRDKQAEFAALQMLFGNPYLPRAEKMKALEDYKTKWNPTDEQRLNRRLAELNISKAERELNAPAAQLKDVKEGDSLVMVDPRTGEARTVAQGGQKLSNEERTAIIAADDAIASGQSALSTLKEMRALNDKTYSGYAAQGRAAIVDSVVPWPTPEATNTVRMNQMAQERLLGQLKATFGGNPTEGERKILLDVEGLGNKSREARAKILQDAENMMAVRLRQQQQRADQIRNKTYFNPGGGDAANAPVKRPSSTGGIEDRKEINGKPYVKIGGQWYEG